MQKRKTAAFVIAACTVFLPFLFPGEASAAGENDVISQGVKIEDVDVSNMTASEAKQAVEEYISQIGERKVSISVFDSVEEVSLKDLGLVWENEDVIESAVNLGKSGNLIERYKVLQDLEHETHTFELDLKGDEGKIMAYVNDTLTAHNQEAVEPTIRRENGEFIITESQTGVAVDEETTISTIYDAVANGWRQDGISVEAATTITEPSHTSDELKTISDALGTYSTTYRVSNQGRTQSLELSAQRVNGVVVYPGEEISISTLMGERSIEGGYGTGQGYLNAETVDMIGAGICQTSSTIYCAALEAEVKVTERWNHSKIVTYVPYAMDATIYAGDDYTNPQKDLKLRNDFENPFFIEITLSHSGNTGTITATIYGTETRPENREVKYTSTTLYENYPTAEETVYVDDPSLPAGQTEEIAGSYPEVKATLTKTVLVDGGVEEEFVLHTDTYKKSAAKIRRGTGAAAETSAETTGETTGETSAAAETQAETQPVDAAVTEGGLNEGEGMQP